MRGVLPHDRTWLAQHLDEWVDVGIVDDEQRAAIEAYEHERDEAAAPSAPRRLSIGAEVAAYIGVVLALTGGAAAIGESWERWSFPARLALAFALAAVGLGIGHRLFRIGESGTDRVGGVVATLGVGGIALATGLIVDEMRPRSGGWIPWWIGAAVLVASVLLWRNRNRPLQLVTAIVGFGLVGVATADLAGDRFWIAGVVVVVGGLSLAVLGHLERAHPPLIAVAGGGVGAFLGAFMLADLNDHLGPSLALAIALAFVLYSVDTDFVPLLVLSIGGATIASGSLLATTFESTVSALGVAVIGLALVAVVISRSARRSKA